MIRLLNLFHPCRKGGRVRTPALPAMMEVPRTHYSAAKFTRTHFSHGVLEHLHLMVCPKLMNHKSRTSTWFNSLHTSWWQINRYSHSQVPLKYQLFSPIIISTKATITYMVRRMYSKVVRSLYGYISPIPISDFPRSWGRRSPTWRLPNVQFRVSSYAPAVHGSVPAPSWRESRGQNWHQEFLLHSSMVKVDAMSTSMSSTACQCQWRRHWQHVDKAMKELYFHQTRKDIQKQPHYLDFQSSLVESSVTPSYSFTHFALTRPKLSLCWSE
jgi:hypothetical protein